MLLNSMRNCNVFYSLFCSDQVEDSKRPDEPGAGHAARLGQAQRDRTEEASLTAGEDQK